MQMILPLLYVPFALDFESSVPDFCKIVGSQRFLIASSRPVKMLLSDRCAGGPTVDNAFRS